MHRVRDAGAHEHRDALALEEALHDQRLALIAAMHLDERGAVVGGALRERDHLAHAVSIITQVRGNPFHGERAVAGVQSAQQAGGGSWTSTNTSEAFPRS